MAVYKNLILKNTRSTETFTTTNFIPTDPDKKKPDRVTHAQVLLTDLSRAKQYSEKQQEIEPVRQDLQFIPMNFIESPDFKMNLDRIENSKGVQVINAKEYEGCLKYLIGIPEDEFQSLQKKLESYQLKNTPNGNPRYESLACGIKYIRPVRLKDYWTGSDKNFPMESEVFWWEVWLRDDSEEIDVEEWFRSVALDQKIKVSSYSTKFPGIKVILAFTSFNEWQNFPGLLNYLNEFRRASSMSSEFFELNPSDRGEFIKDFLSRIRFAPNYSPAVCILDTGVNNGHPLLSPAFSPNTTHAVNPKWGSYDHEGHGTEMAGLALYGALNELLLSKEELALQHQLESVKILPPHGINDPPDYGPITVKAMNIANTIDPDRSRVFSMAVTAEGNELGRPSLWSASIDQSCAGVDDGVQKLLVVSTGNLWDHGKNYPNDNYLASIEDPAQSWNALTVGAHTELSTIREQGFDGFQPIAMHGSLSPTSLTSVLWNDSSWPYKPDVVFEGGNRLKDEKGTIRCADDLELLTTQLTDDGNNLLGTSRDTSAATAQVARMAAILQSEYPNYWPETIRGLIVHSAEWTDRMLDEFPNSSRKECEQRLKVYGMGVPNLERARDSASGFTTMIIQDALQPYYFDDSEKKDKTNEMHLHDLPLPQKVLEDLADSQIKMRVTLSYFIEPNPPRRGYVVKYNYKSHGLRFSVIRPHETLQQMRIRLNRNSWPEKNRKENKRPERAIPDNRNWDLGESLANRGSIHSDTWNGTAAELAASRYICVYPVSGWWRNKSSESSIEKKARYSLIVTISTDNTELKLYEGVVNEIESRAKVRSITATEIDIN